MSNKITIFEKQFEGTEVKMIQGENGDPLFELYSTGSALGYGRWTESKGKKYFKIEKTRIDKIMENGSIKGLAQDGLTYLNEEMLYDFMFESKTGKCKEFRKWVTSEVLPSIRKTGSYVNPQLDHRDTYILDLAKAMQITNTVVSGMVETVTRMEEFVKDSLNSKDIQIDKTAAMIGLRARNTSMLSSSLKSKLSDITGLKILGTSHIYEKFKFKVFREFNVTAWEQISIGNYNRVYAFIDSIESV